MKFILLRLIRSYQRVSRVGVSSPFLLGAFSGCRSWPTCSEFAYSAIEREGVLRGGFHATVHFLRCNPLVQASSQRT